MKKVRINMLMVAAAILLLAPAATAQKRHKTSHPRRHVIQGRPVDLSAPAPGATAPMAVPKDKGRSVMTNQISNSGNVIPTPVPPPKRVVIVPAPPPPGGTTVVAPGK